MWFAREGCRHAGTRVEPGFGDSVEQPSGQRVFVQRKRAADGSRIAALGAPHRDIDRTIVGRAQHPETEGTRLQVDGRVPEALGQFDDTKGLGFRDFEIAAAAATSARPACASASHSGRCRTPIPIIVEPGLRLVDAAILEIQAPQPLLGDAAQRLDAASNAAAAAW